MRWPSRLRPLSFRAQIVLVTTGATALAMVALTLVLQLVLAHLAGNDIDRVLRDRASSVVASITIKKNGDPFVPPRQLSAGVALYGADGSLLDGNVPESLEEDYSELRRTTKPVLVTRHESSRIDARPFRHGRLTGVIIVSEPNEPYAEAERLALVVSLVTGLIVTAATAAVAAVTTKRALRPVQEMARTAAEWSEHDLARRFDLGEPTNEIGSLAATLDALLDRVADAIRSEQRLTAELAHELRTPLTAIQGEAELMLLRDELPASERTAVEDIVGASRRMGTTIATLLELARTESSVVASSRSSLVEVLDEVRRDAPTSTASLEVDVADVRLAVPHPLAVRAIAPVVSNALKFARSTVRISAEPQGRRRVEVRVEDDGPGPAAGTDESIFEPGSTTSDGAGLGLAISRRVARSGGGDVSVSPLSTPGSTCFVVLLPVV